MIWLIETTRLILTIAVIALAGAYIVVLS